MKMKMAMEDDDWAYFDPGHFGVVDFVDCDSQVAARASMMELLKSSLDQRL